MFCWTGRRNNAWKPRVGLWPYLAIFVAWPEPYGCRLAARQCVSPDKEVSKSDGVDGPRLLSAAASRLHWITSRNGNIKGQELARRWHSHIISSSELDSSGRRLLATYARLRPMKDSFNFNTEWHPNTEKHPLLCPVAELNTLVRLSLAQCSKPS